MSDVLQIVGTAIAASPTLDPGFRYQQGPYVAFALPTNGTSSLNNTLLCYEPVERVNFALRFLDSWVEGNIAFISTFFSPQKDKFVLEAVKRKLVVATCSDGTQLRCGYELQSRKIRHLLSVRGGDNYESVEDRVGRLSQIRAYADCITSGVVKLDRWPNWRDQRHAMSRFG